MNAHLSKLTPHWTLLYITIISDIHIVYHAQQSRHPWFRSRNILSHSPVMLSLPKWTLVNNPDWGLFTRVQQDCFLPKRSYAYPRSVIIFMSWNLYRKVPLCLKKQNVWTYKLRKVHCFKRLWLERNDWIWLHLFINADARPSWHISVVQENRSLHGTWNSLL